MKQFIKKVLCYVIFCIICLVPFCNLQAKDLIISKLSIYPMPFQVDTNILLNHLSIDLNDKEITTEYVNVLEKIDRIHMSKNSIKRSV